MHGHVYDKLNQASKFGKVLNDSLKQRRVKKRDAENYKN
jgi:hypothetical protein